MSTLKEMIQGEDLAIFLNADEFAEEHTIGYIGKPGIKVMAVVQTPTNMEKFQNEQDYAGYDGIYGTEYIVHCKKADLPEVPAEGVKLKLDGKICEVSSCADDMGMLSITMHASSRR